MGDADNSVQQITAKALSESSIATGRSSIAGCKAWWWEGYEVATHQLYLSPTKVKQEDIWFGNIPDDYSVKSFDHGIVAGDYISIVNDDHYDYCLVVQANEGVGMLTLAVPNTTSGQANRNPFEPGVISTGIKPDDGYDAYCVIDLTNPGVGVLDVGQSSSASGISSIAPQIGSNAFGYNTSAGGQYSTAFGRGTSAAYGSVAEGYMTEALEWYSHAEGMETKALYSASHAQGRNTIAGAKFAFSSGFYTKALGRSSISGGEYAETYGAASFAFGTNTSGFPTKTIKDASIAFGDGAEANAQFSAAFGYRTDASEKTQFVVGKYNKITDQNYSNRNATELFIVGSGSSTARKNAFVVTANDSIAVGNSSVGTSQNSIGYGRALVNADYAIAGGEFARALARGSISIGRTATEFTTATGEYSIALGAGPQAPGNFSLAQGYRTRVFTDCQVAIGKYNTTDYNSTDNYWLFAVGDGGGSQRHNAFTVYSKTSTAKPRIKIGDTELSEEKLIELLALIN